MKVQDGELSRGERGKGEQWSWNFFLSWSLKGWSDGELPPRGRTWVCDWKGGIDK